ncbi:right-handed parallel beta-helix repeat-containing protein [Streptomyces hyderabadensis]|uniref:Right handed beta helix domain-containing protein n=1 Tax=Streptomyces hyderabadensis TaxID=598549 RepID=A0ABP9I8N3_9ACTN|nr:right-handed parallel beta-helix repeat-containing protein [Streptomyces hyderabadensis]
MGAYGPGRTLALVIGTLLPVALLQAQPAGAAEGDTSATYYVDNRPGSNCGNDHTGTDPASPWCGFAPVKDHTFGPGDRLLLARGAVFAEHLSVKGEGSAEAPAEIDAYGEGARPRIVKNSTGTGVLLNNPSHWAVRNLDVGSSTNGKGDLQYGIRANFTSPGHTDLVFEDIHVHDNRVVGLHVVNNGPYSITQPVLTGLRIRRVESSHNAHGVLTSTNKTASDLSDPRVPGKSGENAFTDAVFDHLDLHDDDNNNGPSTPSQVDVGCPDGLALSNVTDAVITNSTLRNEASCRTLYGTAALYLGNARNILVANNVFTETPNTQNPDMVAIDHESRTSNVRIRGNYFGDNFGGGIEFLAIHGADDWHVDGDISDNAFADNGVHSNIPYPSDGAIAQVGDDIPVAAEVKGNLHHEPFGFLTAKLGGDVSRFERSGNVPVAERDDLTHAGQDFGAPADGSPWSYTARDADGQWTKLPWNAERHAYTSAAGTVDRFTSTAGTARVWTAPHGGTVNIRGIALPTDAAAGASTGAEGTASVRITRNGHPLAGPWHGIGAAGRATNADDVRVRAGDVIRFETADGSAPVGWAPSVGYSAASNSADDAPGTWSFDANGDTQGWTSDKPVEAKRGSLGVTASGARTELKTSAALRLRPEGRSAVRLRLDNDTRATSGTVTFTTFGGRTGSVPFHLNPEETRGLAVAYREFLVPLGDDPAWDGTVRRLSVAFDDADGHIAVDRIGFDDPPAKSWDFTEGAEGWTYHPDASSPSPGSPVGDADLVTDVDNAQGTFNAVADTAWSNTRMQTFKATRGSLARLDVWASRSGEPEGALFVRIVRLDSGGTTTDDVLFTGSVEPADVSPSGDWATVYPGLEDLDPDATYAIQLSAPYQAPGGATYGVGYNDAGLYTGGREYYSVDAGGAWHGPEAGGRRSLKFRTFAFADGAAAAAPDSGYRPATVQDGGVVGPDSGYEPVLLSPDGLDLEADEHRYVRIRMSNPDNRSVGYLLFTTKDNPDYDIPGAGSPAPNEAGLKGVAIPLVPGAEHTEYVLDMSTVPGWKGTITQLKVQPLNRWSYYRSSLTGTWHGAIDYVRVD